MPKIAEKGSISIAFVREALDGVVSRNIAPEPLLRAAGIPSSLLHSTDSRVTPESFGALWLAIARVLDDEFFGLDSRRMKVGSYAVMCQLALGGKTLGQATSRICAFLNMVLDDTLVALVVDAADAKLVLSDRRNGISDDGRRVYAHETLFVLIRGLMCWLIDRRIGISQARFSYGRPAWSREYELIFSSDLVFDDKQTTFIFSAACLQARIVQDERSLGKFLTGAPGNFLLKYREGKSLSARVRRRLRDSRPEPWPSCERVAREFGMAASTLHRKLEIEGTSFRAVRDDLRRDLAIKQLTQSDLTIGDIAYSLGFAERSAFHRAFKCWTGVRPGAYRDLHVSAES